jgi:hypothetical protein
VPNKLKNEYDIIETIKFILTHPNSKCATCDHRSHLECNRDYIYREINMDDVCPGYCDEIGYYDNYIDRTC